MSRTCKIEIIDYKNIKFHGLEPEDRRACSNLLKFKDPKARYMPSVRLGRWDGTVSFFSIGGSTYMNFLPAIIPLLEKKGYDFELVDRRPDLSMKFSPIDEKYFGDFNWPAGHYLGGTPITLHDHQVNAINTLLEHDTGLLAAATSSGKTLICAALSKQVESYGRSLIVVPSRDLVEQTYEDYVNLNLDVGKVYHGSRELDKTHTICTWQSLHSINKKKNEELLSSDEIDRLLDGTIMSIQDEVHLATSKAMFHINSVLLRNVPLTYGLTGTIPKEEHLRESLRANFGEVVYTIQAKELQEKGILSKSHIEINQIQMDKKTYADYATEKKKVNTDEQVLALVAADIIEVSSDEKGNALVLVENIETGEILQEMIPGSVFLSGRDKSKVRKAEYKEVSVENNKVIIATYGIASTGISINRLFNLILFNPGKSFPRTIQSIGRGLRVAHDKDYINIKDYAFNTKYSARHLTERKSYYKECEYNYTVIKRKLP